MDNFVLELISWILGFIFIISSISAVVYCIKIYWDGRGRLPLPHEHIMADVEAVIQESTV